jgi:hypothetical protein
MNIFLELMSQKKWDLVRDCIRVYLLPSSPDEESFEALKDFFDLLNQFVPEDSSLNEDSED